MTRRQMLATGVAVSTVSLPFYSRANQRPLSTHGLQSGDIAHGGAIIWERID